MGLSVPSLSTGIVTSLPPTRAGMGSGLNSAAREIGAALGVAIVGTVLASHSTNALPTALQVHGDSISKTLSTAQKLGTTVHAQAVNASPTRWQPVSQAGFDGDLDPRMSSWGEEILHGHVEIEEVSGGAAGAGCAAGVRVRPPDRARGG